MTERRQTKRTGEGDYEVGYGRPPRHTQFKKGQPRPPRKPKDQPEPSFEDYMAEELKLPMRFVDENGEEQVFPKGKVLAKTSVNKALKNGDLRQIKEFIPRRPPQQSEEVSQADMAMIARFLSRWMAAEGSAAAKPQKGDAPDDNHGEEEDA